MNVALAWVTAADFGELSYSQPAKPFTRRKSNYETKPTSSLFSMNSSNIQVQGSEHWRVTDVWSKGAAAVAAQKRPGNADQEKPRPQATDTGWKRVCIAIPGVWCGL